MGSSMITTLAIGVTLYHKHSTRDDERDTIDWSGRSVALERVTKYVYEIPNELESLRTDDILCESDKREHTEAQ